MGKGVMTTPGQIRPRQVRLGAVRRLQGRARQPVPLRQPAPPPRCTRTSSVARSATRSSCSGRVEEEEAPRRAGRCERLRELTDVHRRARRRTHAKLELYRGYGRQGESSFLLWVEFRLEATRGPARRREDVRPRRASAWCPSRSWPISRAPSTDVASLWGGGSRTGTSSGERVCSGSSGGGRRDSRDERGPSRARGWSRSRATLIVRSTSGSSGKLLAALDVDHVVHVHELRRRVLVEVRDHDRPLLHRRRHGAVVRPDAAEEERGEERRRAQVVEDGDVGQVAEEEERSGRPRASRRRSGARRACESSRGSPPRRTRHSSGCEASRSCRRRRNRSVRILCAIPKENTEISTARTRARRGSARRPEDLGGVGSARRSARGSRGCRSARGPRRRPARSRARVLRIRAGRAPTGRASPRPAVESAASSAAATAPRP